MALARERAGDIDLLITDVVMPGLNGRQLARQVRQLYPHIEVLLMSGYTAEIAAQQDDKELAWAFLEKPFTPEELGLKVREVTGSERRLPGCASEHEQRHVTTRYSFPEDCAINRTGRSRSAPTQQAQGRSC